METSVITKESLKSIAFEIKITKKLFKEAQRVFKHFPYYACGKIDHELWDKEWNILRKLESLQYQYRHRHIAYCLKKGRTYEQIERVVQKGNEPSWNLIRSFQHEIT